MAGFGLVGFGEDPFASDYFHRVVSDVEASDLLAASAALGLGITARLTADAAVQAMGMMSLHLAGDIDMEAGLSATDIWRLIGNEGVPVFCRESLDDAPEAEVEFRPGIDETPQALIRFGETYF